MNQKVTIRRRFRPTSFRAGSLRRRIRSFGSIWLLAAFLGGLNFHIVFFQIYGWTGMVRDYRETSSWSEAIDLTMSGNAPCGVCRTVEAAMSASPDAAGPTLIARGDGYVLPWLLLVPLRVASPIVPPPSGAGWIQTVTLPFTSAEADPPVPPPRLVWV